jgi:hypothetical protein
MYFPESQTKYHLWNSSDTYPHQVRNPGRTHRSADLEHLKPARMDKYEVGFLHGV